MKKSVLWVITEWRAILHSPKAFIPLLGILFIPVLYSGTYLWAFWDPYAHLENLPVAVVNEDAPVTYEGKTYEIGNDLVEELQKDRKFDWHFVSREEADRGFRNNAYYFEILIPRDFSRNATTLTANQPTPLQLTIQLNEGLNFSVARISQTGVEKIRQQLAQNLTEQYTEAVFADLMDLRSGLQEASDGSAELHNGLKEAASGTDKIVSSVKNGAPSVQQLDRGAAKLSRASGQLSSGAAKLDEASAEIAGGLARLDEGYTAVQAGSGQLVQGLDGIVGGSEKLDGAIASFMKQHPDFNFKEDPSWVQISAIIGQVSEGMVKIQDSMKDLDAGIKEIGTKQQQLAQGAQQFNGKLNEFSAGAAQLDKGISSVAEGTHRLSRSWNDLEGGLQRLAAGERDLVTGSGELSNALAEGAGKLENIHASQPLYEMMANPLRLREESLNPLPNYGTGMAPFFVSVSLFVGALLISTIFPMRDTYGIPPSGRMWFLSKFGVLAFISLGQSLLLSAVLIFVIGLEPIRIADFAWFSFFSSLVFMSIVQLFVTAADNVGRFICIILLVMQLTATSGTFPVELIPEALQGLHAFLPISYTVEGFRSILTTGDYVSLIDDSLVLLLFWIACIALTILLLSLMHRHRTVRAKSE
ncbi:YhgE/Pip family protein [Paenibacillus abyssi]|uniref:Phage infection protein n=1 Tax=Paenibacillus abyssi TaxID=1340531 RepID=A0A917CKY7_9BACL|nr:YhgE/Pip domain-containing protein [Paenibacillus abyssi]GGF92004.1 phage infection protein [Paenibacillus abyssi]